MTLDGVAQSGAMERLEPPDDHERARQLEVTYGEFEPYVFGVVGGGHESGVLLIDATRAYRAGSFAAALVCGHASCERELAGWVRWLGDEAPQGWDYWGLGKFIDFAKREGGLHEEVADVLFAVNEHRRLLSHFKDHDDPGSQWNRGIHRLEAARQPRRDLLSSAFMAVLADDALLAIRACLLVRATPLGRLGENETP